jgi:rifampin ADP-ribosylating transferase
MNSEKTSTFYHGSKAALHIGNLIEPGYRSNYGSRKNAKYVYFTASIDAAVWGAELAIGDGDGKIFIVEPTGEFEDDPNLTDKKFPGNPTMSYRTSEALRITGILENWEPHTAEQVQQMKAHLEKLKKLGIEATEE